MAKTKRSRKRNKTCRNELCTNFRNKKEAFEDEITEDIDILFIGALNPRRQAIFDQLKIVAPNLNIVFKNNAWGISYNFV